MSARTGTERTAPARPGWRGLLLVVALAAAACGGADGADRGGSATVEEGEVDPEGVLRMGWQLDVPGGTHFDPAVSTLVTDLTWMQLVFGTLLRETPEGGVEPFLAESYEVVDPQTVTMRLREGLTFSDGTPLDAEAVRASVMRTVLEPASEAVRAAANAGAAGLEDVRVDGPQDVTFVLSTPTAGSFLFAMASREGAIVSPAQLADAPESIDTAPVGAGPYTVEEYEPERTISLRRNPDFHDAESWQLGGVDFVNTPTGPPSVNGLLSDVVDVASLAQPDVERVEADGRYEVTSAVADSGYMLLNLCTGKPPFDDERVRRAVQMGIDREALNRLVFGGDGEAAHGLWPEESPNYNAEVADVAGYDPEAATELLEEAGAEGVTVDIVTTAQSPAHSRLAEVIQQQLDEIGVTVNIETTSDILTEFVLPQRAGAMLIPGSRSGVDKYSRVFAPGSVQALCGETRPEIVEAVAPAAAAEPGSPEAVEAYQAAELLVAEGAFIIPTVYTPQFTAVNTERVGGDPVFVTGLTRSLQLDSVYVTR